LVASSPPWISPGARTSARGSAGSTSAAVTEPEHASWSASGTSTRWSGSTRRRRWSTGLPDGEADFVWGEDAWCYVEDKPKLIAEAVRIVKPGGKIAFTDWVEGPSGLSDAEAEMFLQGMKFPNMQSIAGYRELLEKNGCEVIEAEDTGRFAPYVDLYLNMVEMQLTYDALRILGFDFERMTTLAGGFKFFQELAHAGKIAQGRFIARRR
jgi:SAM-dependent methyltransferase